MTEDEIKKIFEEAENGTLQCSNCGESICEDWSEHTIKDIDCEPCALFQPNDIVENGMCFLCNLHEEEKLAEEFHV